MTAFAAPPPSSPAPYPIAHQPRAAGTLESALLGQQTRARVAFRAARLARVFRLSPEEREDLAQDLWLELVRAMERHDAERAAANAYARGVMDNWYRHTAREIRRRREREFGRVPLDERRDGPTFVDHRGAHVAAADLRMDLAPALSQLPRELAELAEQLRTKSVAEIAADRGVHRGTVHRAVQQLRAALGPLLT